MAEEKERSFFEKASPLFILLSIILAFFVGTLWQRVRTLEKGNAERVQQGATAAPSQAENAKVSMDTIRGLFDKDVIKFGSKDSKLIFVEVSDTSCPFCGIASGKNPELNNSNPRFKLVKDGGTYKAPVEEMKKLLDEGKASFVYIYFPGHGAGEMGAKALYCAYEMDKFWQVHDLLMSSAGYNLLNDKVQNDKTKSGELSQFLKSVVDAAKMKSCLDSGKYDSRLASDMSLASSLGVQGTPGFFVNDTRFDGAYSFSDMEPVVKAALGE
jgi:protein-disulfide isomerase